MVGGGGGMAGNQAVLSTSGTCSSKKRRLPDMIEENDNDGDAGTMRGIVSILAAAKTEGEECKFDFLSEHLQQQGELPQRELDLEHERLDLEREKTVMEQRKTNLMMRQLEASIRMGISQAKGPESKEKKIIINDNKEESDSFFNLKDK
ncbi:hypothetical protein L873DRAFT_1809652 [Choiromyces venosus 120613-1]|uniref:Uncharacterized protein n=1 Tax=Choiromyces venosus 120613-1 TaxID=1336337 RepID=A0A3N4JLG6_9PEZI|nr:hypothetical protein L873DRAFT_1809652 [Choiromyces venosus 120613-1]